MMDLKAVGSSLKENSWDIIEAWATLVLNDEKIETSHELSKYDLINSIPTILLGVSKNIAAPIHEELSSKGLLGSEASNQGRTRLNQNYSLTEVFREFIWLREQILAYLKKKDILNESEYLLHSRLDRALDEQLLLAASTYTEHYTKQLREKAVTDSLTKLYNRSAFFDFLNKELTRAKRYSHPLSLLMMDLDNFKQYNDKLGHLAGDNYLKSLGRFLAGHSRLTDIAARLGGDEFAIILPETSLDEALEVAERIQASFKKTPELQTDVTQVGISMGVGINNNFGSLELYNLADRALYKAKKRGPNNIVTINELPEKAA